MTVTGLVERRRVDVALLDRLVRGIEMPPVSLPWMERLRGVATGYRAAALRNPQFFKFAVLHRMNTATGLAYLERILGIFRDAGFDEESTARLFRALGKPVTSWTIRSEAEAQAALDGADQIVFEGFLPKSA